MEALIGRRSRRFALGDEIPDGPLAYKSRHEPVPLTELERTLVLASMGGHDGVALITAFEIAKKMRIQLNYVYRVMGDLLYGRRAGADM